MANTTQELMTAAELWEKLLDRLEELDEAELAQIYSIYCGKPVIQVDDDLFAVITPPSKEQEEIKV